MSDELIAKTPFGEIVVGIKSDPDYPGIFVELRGELLNDRFKEGAVRLAWVEYSSDKQTCRPSSMEMEMQMISRILLSTNTFSNTT